MKITAVLLLATLQVAAKGWGQDQISLSFSNAPLEQVFNAITAQTSIAFLYRPEYVKDKKVTVKITNASLKAVLDICLKDQKLVYQIVGKTVAIHPAHKVNSVSGTEGITNTPPVDIKGRIIDSKGEAIPNATVSVKGSVKNTITNANGEFTLSDVEENAVLVVTHVQYEMESIVLKGNKSITISLQIKVNSLDEMQVIAYGTTTRRFNTGNIASVKAEEIARQPVNNPLLALQGRVPGLFITQNTGFSGGGATVLIQGRKSIGRGNDPFYVIDGVPFVSQLLPTNLGGVLSQSGVTLAQNGNPLSYINPSDIESITILKDADATAIYGSRAANGAILITTKKGKSGKVKANFDLQQGWGKVTRKLDLLNTQQYITMRREALKNDNVTVAPTDANYDVNGTWDSTSYTDWQKEFLGGISKYSNYNASISGGTNNTQIFAGATYHRETTVFPGDFTDQKGALHFSLINTSVNQKFKAQLSFNYMLDDNRLPSADLTSSIVQLAPNAPAIYNDDGSLNWKPNDAGVSTFTANPAIRLNNSYVNKTSNLIGNAILSYQLLRNLEIQSSFGYNELRADETVINPGTTTAPEFTSTNSRVGNFGNNLIRSWIIEPQLRYKRSIGIFNLEALVGSSIQENTSRGLQLAGIGYNSDQVIEDITAATLISPVAKFQSLYRYYALFGKLNVKVSNRYILDLSARRDGSSRFGAENQFHNFGAIGLGWIFTEEKLLKDHLSFLTFGKLRASFGVTGSDQINDYQFLNLYRPVTSQVPYLGSTGLAPAGLPNPYLQWEETKKINVGLDLGFFSDRINVNANYYRNRTSNQLLSYALPMTTGFQSITENFPATVQNTGFEFSINSMNIKSKHFTWSSSINFTIPKNKLVEFPNLENSVSANNLIIGQPITIIKGFQYVGVDPTTGTFQVQDIHGNTTSSPNFNTDRFIPINTGAVFYGGFSNTITIKNFEVDFLFQYVKQKGLNYAFGNYPGYFSSATGNQPVSVLNRWQKPGDNAANQRFNSNLSLAEQFYNVASFSDAAYTDASYIRLKNISASWQLPDRWIQSIRFNYIKLFVQGQNVLTFTDYIGLNPENASSISLPPLKVITVGARMGL